MLSKSPKFWGGKSISAKKFKASRYAHYYHWIFFTLLLQNKASWNLYRCQKGNESHQKLMYPNLNLLQIFLFPEVIASLLMWSLNLCLCEEVIRVIIKHNALKSECWWKGWISIESYFLQHKFTLTWSVTSLNLPRETDPLSISSRRNEVISSVICIQKLKAKFNMFSLMQRTSSCGFHLLIVNLTILLH